MTDYSTYKCEDLASDQLFINWVRHPSPDSDAFWAAYPALDKEIADARLIVQSMEFEEKELPEADVRELWHAVYKDTNRYRATVYFWRIAAACAASAAIIFGLWKWSVIEKQHDVLVEYAANLATPIASGNEVQIVLSDDTNYTITGNDAEIKYDEKGQLKIDSQEVVRQSQASGSEEIKFNQVIVPWGKRTTVSFADGTRIWLNAGSRAVYPVEFTGNRREVFIEGEAYFEVARNENKPFIVKTGVVEVIVLGTEFNVNAYPQERKTEVALVNGSVQVVGRNRQVTQLRPEHVVEIDHTTEQQLVKHVDVYDYICWKDGFLQFRSENPDIILRKIERHYAIPINIEAQLDGYTITGKLDLKENMTGTLDIIARLLPVQYQFENDTVFIREK